MINDQKVLILGGTGETSALITQINQIPGVSAIASFAGRTELSVTLTKTLRVGGFGGITGLVDYLQTERIDYLIDATHPFAAQISFHAAQAADYCGIPRLMLVRPAWDAIAGDIWIEVKNHQAARDVLPDLAQRIFLTIGRQELLVYADLQELWFLMRMIELPLPNIPIPSGKILLQRGCFSLEHERSLLQEYQIGAIVSKNSGGDATYSKIMAARELRLPVVMIKRPPFPEGEQVPDVNSVITWLKTKL